MPDALPPPPPARSDDALQYTHSGERYLLGYGDAYFGIWDRGRSAPLERFPRTSDGWRAAWRRYAALQPAHAEVALGAAPVAAPVVSAPSVAPPQVERPAAPAVSRPTHAAWWLLPILMGWMGGLIAWMLIREQHPDRARAMLVTGIVATVVWIVLYSVIAPTPPT
jgi:uncharacterized membrane protein YeaQ/YmgE (transglycosylase-associated protein family)